ncbi:TIGR04222 domain-containing membrane protein [Blastococcus sp. PRF04-17]|uniref:TIGR04222 domain-containing membrane protein n=1 Tax=Blastococcus sp. PRF04-17 TaxID=2933797 RepID=UPI001FF369D3|nr:TIGR04222 domain-containing membrane protein [Blastococcus sp. PRF04-17]UOY01088.1 TIGR04222 domain-containing membrane protein [Blastococcus sp. PRF04-17]
MTVPPLDVYETAFLAGGPDRVVDTAVVVLVESGRVRVHSPGELASVDATRRHPVEAAVLDAVGTRGHRSVDTIRWRLSGDDRITCLAARLVAAGLLRRQPLRGRGKWCATRAGRDLLRQRPATDPALDGGSAIEVALRGRAAMADAGLRAAIFERPPLPQPSGADISRRLRDRRRLHESADPSWHVAQSRTALGGAVGIGFVEGGGGDGGGL